MKEGVITENRFIKGLVNLTKTFIKKKFESSL